MSLILNIETATKTCSVGLAENGTNLSCIEETSDQFVHAERLNVFIDKVIKDAGKKISDLNAICVSKGPGSFTGLRIGVASAKGLCYGLGIPFIAVDSLTVLAATFLNSNQINAEELLVPMIDARRMEVYTAILNQNLEIVEDISAKIIDENSFNAHSKTLHLFGDGALKFQETIKSNNVLIHSSVNPSAKAMAKISFELFLKNKFEDTAYFEPYYLKDFIVGSKNNIQ